jgi:hypothetical protein
MEGKRASVLFPPADGLKPSPVGSGAGVTFSLAGGAVVEAAAGAGKDGSTFSLAGGAVVEAAAGPGKCGSTLVSESSGAGTALRGAGSTEVSGAGVVFTDDGDVGAGVGS